MFVLSPGRPLEWVKGCFALAGGFEPVFWGPGEAFVVVFFLPARFFFTCHPVRPSGESAGCVEPDSCRIQVLVCFLSMIAFFWIFFFFLFFRSTSVFA